MAKKALHYENEANFVYINGRLEHHQYPIEKIVEGVNCCCDEDWDPQADITKRFRIIRSWLERYMRNGPTEPFLNNLNKYLSQMRIIRNVMPPRFFNKEDESPRCISVADFSFNYSPQVLAAYDFSKLLTLNRLQNLNRCELQDCRKFFVGPKRAKFCNKTCGSKSRVRKMRKRNRQ